MIEDEKLQSNWFWRDLEEGVIHIRDQLQLELKSEISLDPEENENVFSQEFFFFIPETLQINARTYPKEQFFGDETNIIRFKTPDMSFQELMTDKTKSPLIRLENLIAAQGQVEDIVHEIQMLGNIFRSSIRNEIKDLIDKLSLLKDHEIPPDLREEILVFVNDVQKVLVAVDKLQEKYLNAEKGIKDGFRWIQEYMAIVVDSYLTAFLDFFRRSDYSPADDINQALVKIIVERGKPGSSEDELIRFSLLNKYMLEALQIKNEREETKQKHSPVLGMAAAGVAMFTYMVLFVWKAQTIAITSFPFILFAVLFYILKDRLKDGMKELYWKNYTRWFPDYSTKLLNSFHKVMGRMEESVLFLDKNIPEDILKWRSEVHALEDMPSLMPESCLYYKKVFYLDPNKVIKSSRRQEITTLFRLNFHKFLEKANDSVQTRLKLDQDTLKIVEKKLPKSYFLTLILKNREKSFEEIKKFRVVINKLGVDRVYFLGSFRQLRETKRP